MTPLSPVRRLLALPLLLAAASAHADIVVGAGAGGPPQVNLFASPGNAPAGGFLAYPPSFTGGVNVAVGDINGDGTADVVTGAGPGAGPHVKVFDGRTGAELSSFLAFAPAYSGGVFVAAGDVDGDGRADIVAGGGGMLNAFSGTGNAPLGGFQPFGTAYSGGVRVAVGDVDGDGRAELVAGTDAGEQATVRVFRGLEDTPVTTFSPFPGFSGGVNVATGDVNGDGAADIVTGAGAGGGPHVKVFDGATGALLHSFFPFDAAFTGGVSVAAGDLDGDGRADIVVGAGLGGGPVVKVYDGTTLALRGDFFAFDPQFTGGVSVGVSAVPEPSTWVMLAAGLGALIAMRRRAASAG